MKLVFLLRRETVLEKDPSFYDFVPYKYGPFSFSLYRELDSLRQYGYVTSEKDRISLCNRNLELTKEKTRELPAKVRNAVEFILGRYGKLEQDALVRSVYRRYPWFALNSELPERRLASVKRPKKASLAVYTAGYEGRSVDAFFNDLMQRGLRAVVDVRSNPISRKYGFGGARFAELCNKVGFQYHHLPSLGIPSTARAGLGSFDSYQLLLTQYEQVMLPERSTDLEEVGTLMLQQPSVLVCFERDASFCHRSRLAGAVANAIGLDVVHL
ncbi:MAG: DUF488 domain-containing protein [SAR324 cluster bacterium]|nr:DUF488 domain-containing protein [SAR324 cluster bacterium]